MTTEEETIRTRLPGQTLRTEGMTSASEDEDQRRDDHGNPNIRRRKRFKGDDDLIILREVLATGAYAAPYGQTGGYFSRVAERFNADKEASRTDLTGRKAKDRYRVLVMNYRKNDLGRDPDAGTESGALNETPLNSEKLRLLNKLCELEDNIGESEAAVGAKQPQGLLITEEGRDSSPAGISASRAETRAKKAMPSAGLSPIEFASTIGGKLDEIIDLLKENRELSIKHHSERLAIELQRLESEKKRQKLDDLDFDKQGATAEQPIAVLERQSKQILSLLEKLSG